MYHMPVTNMPYFGYNSHPNFQRHPLQHRPMFMNGNAYFRKTQQNFDNSEQHWCETCDRGFNTPQQLEKHKEQHQKCNIDGCQFVAHPKVITKHIQMQHSSGLYKRIAKLNNPEEIKKWIEERKKKYPTKENIEKKSAEIKEKIERGEKMGLRQDRFQRNNSQGQGVKRRNTNNNGCKQQGKHIRRNNFVKTKPPLKKPKKEVQPKKLNINTVAPIDETRKLRPFTGIQNIDMDSDTGEETGQPDCKFDIEDEDFETNNNVNEVKFVSEPTVCGALSSLMCNYGSSDEENEDVAEVSSETKLNVEQNKVEIKTETSKAVTEETKKVDDQSKSDDDSGPEEIEILKSVDVTSYEVAKTSENMVSNKFRKKDNVEEHKKQLFSRPKPKVPSTLLHKLLRREVQHERNVILQCVRYVVKNNYFNKL